MLLVLLVLLVAFSLPSESYMVVRWLERLTADQKFAGSISVCMGLAQKPDFSSLWLTAWVANNLPLNYEAESQFNIISSKILRSKFSLLTVLHWKSWRRRYLPCNFFLAPMCIKIPQGSTSRNLVAPLTADAVLSLLKQPNMKLLFSTAIYIVIFREVIKNSISRLSENRIARCTKNCFV